MNKIQLWSVAPADGGKLRASSLEEVESSETEARLEELLVGSPGLLLDGLSLVGRQLPSDAGCLDLLGVDEDGRLVVLELKRGTLTREAVAQVLDYASDLGSREPEDLARLIESNSGQREIPAIEDFLDWHGREYPDSTDSLSLPPRMVLVGLGVDARAKRMVNFLAEAGIEIELLTFHAFRSEGTLFLARQVETTPPAPKRASAAGLTKQEGQRLLTQLAEQQGCEHLLSTVADFIGNRLPASYRWPGKTAYSFSLQERTDEGHPTLRSYVTLYVHRKKKGALLVALPPRALEAAPEAVAEFIARVPSATIVDSSWLFIQLEIDSRSWPSIGEPFGSLLDGLREGWQARIDGPDPQVRHLESPRA